MASSRAGRLARLIHLSAEIKTNPRQSPGDLLRTLSISKAQFYKDKKELAKVGFEFKYSRQKDAFEILSDPYIPIFNLTLSEVFALVMAVRQLSSAGDYVLTSEALQGIRKIILESPLEMRDILRASLDDVVLQEGFGCKPEILEELQRAISEHRRTLIFHRSPSDGVLKKWKVDPYQIFFKRRALYVEGYCVEEKDFRMYRLNRIEKAALLPISVPVMEGYSFAKRHRGSFSVFVGKEPMKVRVKFSRRVAPYIKETRWHASQKIVDLPDGGIILELKVSEPKEVGWEVMRWGAEAEVLDPEDIREMVAKMAREMVKLYGRRVD